ncbi:MAG: tripartite tricarboxylate transporter substrate binding protein [Burkholderiales bacterium]|nr:tripartite tricarboxylate transporter substrate binding protein [Burkholderiales bacterium]
MAATAAFAQPASDYPTRPIRFLIPISAGGGADISSRAVATRLSEALGQQVVVDNRPGGAGNIALEFLANALPNGYTMALVTTTHTINRSLSKKLPYDLLKDFVGVSQLTSQPYCLSVNPKVPAKSVLELVNLARAKPGSLHYGSSGIGSLSHLAGEQFAKLGKMTWTHIPYKGGVLGINDMISGQITSQFTTIIGTQQHVKAGRLRWLAISSATRSKVVPDLPTVAESGMPGFDIVGFYGVAMPAATPKPIVGRVSREIQKILQSPEVGGRFSLDGSEPVGNSSEAFTAFIRSEVERYAALTRELGMRPE